MIYGSAVDHSPKNRKRNLHTAGIYYMYMFTCCNYSKIELYLLCRVNKLFIAYYLHIRVVDYIVGTYMYLLIYERQFVAHALCLEWL